MFKQPVSHRLEKDAVVNWILTSPKAPFVRDLFIFGMTFEEEKLVHEKLLTTQSLMHVLRNF